MILLNLNMKKILYSLALGAALIAMAMFLVISPEPAVAQQGAPVLNDITPNIIYNDQTSILKLSGSNFSDPVIVTVEGIPWDQSLVNRISSAEIRMTISANASPGNYTIKVVNPSLPGLPSAGKTVEVLSGPPAQPPAFQISDSIAPTGASLGGQTSVTFDSGTGVYALSYFSGGVEKVRYEIDAWNDAQIRNGLLRVREAKTGLVPIARGGSLYRKQDNSVLEPFDFAFKIGRAHV